MHCRFALAKEVQLVLAINVVGLAAADTDFPPPKTEYVGLWKGRPLGERVTTCPYIVITSQHLPTSAFVLPQAPGLSRSVVALIFCSSSSR
jgi:hypothetical protein